MVGIAKNKHLSFEVAGTLVHWVRQRKEVVYVVCSNNDKGTENSTVKPDELAKIREKEQLKAAKIQEVKEVVSLRHPDQSIEDTLEFRKEIVRLIRIYRPEIVVTSDPYRRYVWRQDQRIVGLVTMDTVFP